MCLTGDAAPKLESATAHIPKLFMGPVDNLKNIGNFNFMPMENSTLRMSMATDEQDSLVGPSRQENQRNYMSLDREKPSNLMKSAFDRQDSKSLPYYQLKSNSVMKNDQKMHMHFMNRKNQFRAENINELQYQVD